MIFENVASQQICAIFIDTFYQSSIFTSNQPVTCSYGVSPESLRCIHSLAEDVLV